MGSAVGRVLTIGAVVLAIPAACVGAVALYGRALAESEVGVGTLVTPAEARVRLEEGRARFRAMTPAQHLEEGRRALATGYDEATRCGGNLGVFERHADAIPEGAPEAAALPALRAEVQQRRAAMERQRVGLFVVARASVARHASGHRDVATASDSRKRALRVELAREVDELSPRGLGCVHAADEADTTLRFDHGECEQGMLDVIAPPDNAAALRAYGFRRVRCANGRGVIEL